MGGGRTGAHPTTTGNTGGGVGGQPNVGNTGYNQVCIHYHSGLCSSWLIPDAADMSSASFHSQCRSHMTTGVIAR